MHLQIYNNRNSKYVRICESYRDDKTGKPKMRVLETFGSLDKLLEQDPNAIEKLKVKVQNLNNQSAQVKQLQVQQAVNSFFVFIAIQKGAILKVDCKGLNLG